MNEWFRANGDTTASIILALSVAWLCMATLRLMFSRRDDTRWDADELKRRVKLREQSFVYRRFEPLVDELVPWTRRLKGQEALEEIEHSFALAKHPHQWRPEEFVTVKGIEALLLSSCFAFVFCWISTVVAVLLAVVTLAGYGPLARKSIRDVGKERLTRIRARLPYAVDLMALILEASGTPLEAFQTLALENEGHPLGEEMGRVVADIDRGEQRAAALEAFRDRLRDNDIDELVFAINKGEELGTPLRMILRTQVDQMRLKQAQWGEKNAGEARVKIVFPNMLIMIACLIAVAAPFLLRAIYARS